MTFDYTDCDTLTPSQSITSLTGLADMPKFSYRLRSSNSKAQINPPKYAFLSNASNPISSQNQCVIQFDVAADLDPSILLYFKLTNFYQNHRRYVKSLDANQLRGDFRSVGDLRNGNCKPVAIRDNKPVYPCGLIANSIFNG
jgi:LEM3 (ligand-effect modulator 3) family / CDC50 family